MSIIIKVLYLISKLFKAKFKKKNKYFVYTMEKDTYLFVI